SSVDYGNVNQVDTATNMVSFNLAQYRVTYTPRRYTVLADGVDKESERYVTRTFMVSANNQRIPGNVFRYVSDVAGKTPIQEGGAFTIPVIEYHMTWHQLPVVPLTNLTDVAGRTNEEKFDNFWQPETLICLAPKIEVIQYPDGKYYQDVEYIFLNRAYEN